MMTTTATMSRHDIPAAVKNLMAVSMRAGIIDAFDLYAMATEHAGNWKTLTEEICDAAFASRHMGDAHEKVVGAAELVWQAIN